MMFCVRCIFDIWNLAEGLQTSSVLSSVKTAANWLWARTRADLNVALVERKIMFCFKECSTWKKVLLEEGILNMENTVATATPRES